MPDHRHLDSGLPWFAFALAACAVVAPYWWQDKMPIEIQYGLWVVAALSFVFGLWKSGFFHSGIVKWLIAPLWAPSDKELPQQEDEASGSKAVDRISLTDLANLASKKYGWTFGDNTLHSLDFLNALAQAIQDDVVTMEGRAGCAHLPVDMFGGFPLKEIPKNHFDDFTIDVPGLFIMPMNNSKMQTMPRNNNGDWRERFVDLHIGDRKDAEAWLAGEAGRWKGRSLSAERDRQEREKQWKQEMREQGVDVDANNEDA